METEVKKTEEAVVVEESPKSLWGKIKAVSKDYGPGIVVVLTWLGAGDLVDGAVAGSQFGYNLMWVLIIANLVRFSIVNSMARYALTNKQGLTIFERFGKIAKFFPAFFLVSTLIMGHLTVAYQLRGTAEALMHLTGFGNTFAWALVVVASTFLLFGKKIYDKLELAMKFLLGLMTLAFIVLAFGSTPDLGAIVRGTILFSVPEGEGLFDVFVVIASMIGAVAGSYSNFFYPETIKEKGWVNITHKRKQRNDLLFSLLIGAVIVLCIWIVGAEILAPNNIQVSQMTDIASALGISMGPVGEIIFYLGAFGVLYSSVIGHSTQTPRLTVQNFNILKPGRKEKYATFESDPLYKALCLFTLISPIIWSIPGMPGFVTLTVFVNALNVLIIPAIALGLIVICNDKILEKVHRNNILENGVLIFATGLALYSTYKIILGFF